MDLFTRPLAKHASFEDDAYSLSRFQEKTFKQIEKALQENKVIAVSTFENVGKLDGLGYSGGEVLSRGIAGNHVYAVVGTHVVTKADGKKIPYVRVANPWGHFQLKQGRIKNFKTGAH